MSEHKVVTTWRRESDEFDIKTYNRGHEWDFGHDVKVPASAAVGYQGDPERVDPEQAFVAALSSCHMLTFLAIAAQRQFTIDSYLDEAVGELGKNEAGQMAVITVTLDPKIQFSGDNQPDTAAIAQLHEMAHKHCFLANSVTTKVVIAG